MCCSCYWMTRRPPPPPPPPPAPTQKKIILFFLFLTTKSRFSGQPKNDAKTLFPPSLVLWRHLYCFAVLGSTSIVIYSVNTHLPRNRPEVTAAASRDFLRERLRCYGIHSCKPASLNRPLGQSQTPSTVFRHLPPNSARFNYATEEALFISAQLSTDAVSALPKVWVLIRLWNQRPSTHADMRRIHPG